MTCNLRMAYIGGQYNLSLSQPKIGGQQILKADLYQEYTVALEPSDNPKTQKSKITN